MVASDGFEQKNTARPSAKGVILGMKGRLVLLAMSAAMMLSSVDSSDYSHKTAFCHLNWSSSDSFSFLLYAWGFRVSAPLDQGCVLFFLLGCNAGLGWWGLGGSKYGVRLPDQGFPLVWDVVDSCAWCGLMFLAMEVDV